MSGKLMHDRKMTKTRLDHKLDCKSCGVIALDIPQDADEHTPIHCSKCGGYLGEWGALRIDFEKQAGHGNAFDLSRGSMYKRA